MPPKTRTRKSKASPPPPSTSSTLHGTTERRHRHSYSGPSTVSPSVKHPTTKPGTNGDDYASAIGISTEGKKTLLADVHPPGSRVSFHKFVYIMAFVALLLLAWWVYGMIVLLEQMRDEVGLWGIIVGDTSGRLRWMDDGRKSWGSWVWFGNRGEGDTSADAESARKTGYVESSLNALADALGVPAVDVAHAVKPLVPSASLASIALKVEETGEVVKVLLEDTTARYGTKQKKGFAENVAGDDVD